MAKRKVNYLSNKNILEQVHLSREKGEPTDELAKMFLMLATRYATKPNFNGYSFVEDMVGDAVLNLCLKWHKFNPEKSSNPFSYFTQIVHNSFIHMLNKEKKHRDKRDALLVDAGMDPSWTYAEEHKDDK